MFEIEPGPSVSDLHVALTKRGKETRDGNIRFVGSGKACVRLIFEYLKNEGVLEHKMVPVMVPPWLGTWVYAEMLSFAFPALNADKAKALLCYHQYGFPQNMDRVLDIASSRRMAVIEDCAHVIDSRYKGRPLGDFGEFALFSYSKFVFCFALGGVSSRHKSFYSFVDRMSDGSIMLRAMVNGFKLIDEANLHLPRPFAATAMNGLRKMAYARYGDQMLPGARAVALWLHKRVAEIQARRDNFALLTREIARWGICDHLERDDVAPYAVPLAVASEKAPTVVAKLRSNAITADIRNFDFARCSFESDYRKCVVVPIHSGMVGQGMDRLISSLKEAL